jgi:hypothetical protein
MRSFLKAASILALAATSLGVIMLVPRATEASSHGHPHGHTSRAHGAVACSFTFIVGHQRCYGPADAKSATAGIPWAVDPSAAVKDILGLNLSQVSVNSMPSSGTSSDVRPVQVDYFYGPLGLDDGRVGASPLVARVIENPGKAQFATGMAPGIPMPVVRDACGTKVEISAAADPQRPHPAYGPWFLIASFPHGNHSVGIVANTDQQTLTRLACTITQAG